MEAKSLGPFALQFAFLLTLLITCMASLVKPSEALAQGKLRQAREAVRQNKPKKKSEPSKRRESKEESDQDRPRRSRSNDRKTRTNRQRNRSQGPRFSSVIDLSALHFPLPYADPIFFPVVDQVVETPSQAVLTYADSSPNGIVEATTGEPPVEFADSIVRESIVVDQNFTAGSFQSRSSVFWGTFGSDFDGITSGGVGARIQSPGSLGLELAVMTLRESFAMARDHLWVGDLNFVLPVISGSNVRTRVGLGLNWLSDFLGSESGLNLTAGADLKLTDRLVLTAEGDVGNLGDADFFHARVHIARRFETYDLVLGADHYNIGGAEINSYFTGLQIRF